MNNKSRQPEFARNGSLEDLLGELNGRLKLAEQDIASSKPELPVLLVIGPPRSGTTVMMQWLANTGSFAYPTNLLSRFYGAPYIGSLVQQLIFDERFNFKNELNYYEQKQEFTSDLGKTTGPLQPNEFWYFWRRFIDIDQAERLSTEALENFDQLGFLAGLAKLQMAFGKPWAMKGIILQYNLKFLSEVIPNVLFLWMNRNPVYNGYSLLRAREKYFGDIGKWFSVQPPGYEQLLSQSAHEQVLGQIRLTHDSISEEVSSIDASRFLKVDYEQFCLDPAKMFGKISEKLAAQGYTELTDYNGPSCLEPNNYSSLKITR